MVQTANRLSTRTSERWRKLYERVILEPDQSKWPQRIAEARRAILSRAEEIGKNPPGEEHQHLENALRTLRSLEEVAAREKPLHENKVEMIAGGEKRRLRASG